MMFVQLLVFTCACALGATDEVPPYGDISNSIIAANDLLKNNILSMDGNVPLLNDPRRHYAEIIHVVHDEAKQHNTKLIGPVYTRDYQRFINVSGPFAVANPQSVVDGTNKVISDIFDSIDEILQLVNASAQNGNPDSDKAIDEEINNNFVIYGWSKKVFLATGIVATQLNNNHKDFAASSQNLSAHNFVITGVKKLEEIVMALRDLYQILYPPPHG